MELHQGCLVKRDIITNCGRNRITTEMCIAIYLSFDDTRNCYFDVPTDNVV